MKSIGFKNIIKIKLVCVLFNGVEILKLNIPRCINRWEFFLLYISVSHLERKATLLLSFAFFHSVCDTSRADSVSGNGIEEGHCCLCLCISVTFSL